MHADSYDYIVTGAGSAGCLLAARLTENPAVRVLLLEAGERDKNILFHWPAGFARMTKGIASWGWETVPQRQMNNRVLWYTQAKVIGGGSTINAQVYTRGNAVDYDAWRDAAGCNGWSYRELLPYFKRSEGNEIFSDPFHGVDGPLGVSQPVATLPVASAFIRAAQQYGIPYNADFNGARQAGVGFYQVTQRHARRSSMATAFLKPAMDRPNLTVKTGSQALKILIENQQAIGIQYAQKGTAHTAYASSEVVVTSGAIGSPRLMLLSGIGSAQNLESVGIDVVHELPGVGENLHDHLDLFTIAECSGRYSYDRFAKPHHALKAAAQYLLFRNGPAASSLFETGAFWRSSADQTLSDQDPCDLQFHFGQGSGIEAGVASMPQGGVTLNVAYMRPKSRGTVRLQSANPEDTPLIDPNYWQEPEDRQRHIQGLKIAREILQQPALKPFLKAERLPGPGVQTDQELFEYTCANAKTQHHPVGTCKMGVDDMAVVDPQLKVRGIERLRICDSSIMPAINSSNTNAATIMIGEKAADMIRGLPPLPAGELEGESRITVADE